MYTTVEQTRRFQLYRCKETKYRKRGDASSDVRDKYVSELPVQPRVQLPDFHIRACARMDDSVRRDHEAGLHREVHATERDSDGNSCERRELLEEVAKTSLEDSQCADVYVRLA